MALLGKVGPSGKLEGPSVWIDYSQLPSGVQKKILQCKVISCEAVIEGKFVKDDITGRKIIASRLNWIKWTADMNYIDAEGLPEIVPGAVTAIDYLLGTFDKAHPPNQLIGYIVFITPNTSWLETPLGGPYVDVLTRMWLLAYLRSFARAPVITLV